MNTLFPIFLKADRLQFLIVGGGAVALEKLHFLQKSSPQARVQLVALKVLPEVMDLVGLFPNAQVFQRAFSVEDIADKHLVIAATNNKALNDELRWLADRYRFILNVADKPELCDFYLGGVVTKGDLKLAISTNGKSPIMAKRLRQTFEAILPPTLEETISKTHALRNQLHGDFDEKLKQLNELTQKLIG